MRLNSKQIAEYTGGSFIVEPIDRSLLACGITWDSREIERGDLYVALPGERTDGHAYVGAALRSGAAVALVQERPDEATCLLAREMGAAIIEVSSTHAAVTDLARAWRGFLRGHIVALTGSTGKTTTKNLVRDVLAASFTVVATAGNQNNELGVPKTLLSADPETEVIVVEMGMRGRGQIAALCDFVKPGMGLITNVGESHIELLGSRENIARAKAELVEALPNGTGAAFLNASDEFTPYICEVAKTKERALQVWLYDGSADGADAAADAYATDVALDDEGRPRFTLHVAGEEAPCALSLRGLHNVQNACAAAAVAAKFGMGASAIARALEQAQPEAGRQHVIRARGGFTVIDDAYNANPDSMRASLAMFSSLAVSGRRVAVLGDMGELGEYAVACHEGIGRAAAAAHLDYLLCVGELAGHIARAAREAGMDADTVLETDSVPGALGELDNLLEAGDAVLVKASHFMGLERVVGGLVN
ncbi:UDP-N-acetylmuramoyl-tripeptide--D-alanyl-D-alanine ligase [Raoultibacter phocaeensis]|uniref:UDP-N-acetylmuramoyl-tripeptide--D-alanyl-D- alanine ligase n=1 Tax=Raoultibacter phocaeensis TaxID=2479841 RepID=UPI00111AD95A|nr:UDP-N-acetylmuramoyl-tripeptide--D-alanyl-D-alanine ligase [Raoultibacter phocaeensis]